MNDVNLAPALIVEYRTGSKCGYGSCSKRCRVRLTSGRMSLYRIPFCWRHAEMQLALIFPGTRLSRMSGQAGATTSISIVGQTSTPT